MSQIVSSSHVQAFRHRAHSDNFSMASSTLTLVHFLRLRVSEMDSQGGGDFQTHIPVEEIT